MTLEEKLWDYGINGRYPFHMPGHKRNAMKKDSAVTGWINDIHRFDITEIEGFDNLHHAEEIILELEKEMSEFYGTRKTYPLVGGSTSGILSAITACARIGDEILISRNCHKSVLNACTLRNLKPIYLSPKWIGECGIYGGVTPEDVDKAIKNNPGIKAVVIVSPTYEGIVSDIEGISEITRREGIPLIVDEAHGAHLSFRGDNSIFPKSAVNYGDIVIQSLHKTLPCMTQTALIHLNGDLVKKELLENCLQAYQSSSPSYIMMADISHCFHYMKKHPGLMRNYEALIMDVRNKIKNNTYLRLLGESEKGKYGVFDYDYGKLTIIPQIRELNGKKIFDILRRDYDIELEMSNISYCVAMSSILDTKEGLDRLVCALEDIGKKFTDAKVMEKIYPPFVVGKSVLTPAESLYREKESISVKESEGRICGENIYVYPPGSVFLAAGELICQDMIDRIERYEKEGFEVIGVENKGMITVLKG